MMNGERSIEAIPYIQPHFNHDTKNYQEYLRYYNKMPLLYYQFTMGEGGQDHLPAIPDGCLDIIFKLSSSMPSIKVYGSLLLSNLVPFEEGVAYFGIRFPPGCTITFQKIKMEEYVENVIDLDMIMKVEEKVLELLLEDSTFEKRVIYVEETIVKSILAEHTSSPLTNHLINEIIKSKGGKPIHQLALETHYSDRYIRQKISERLGISPKNFSRIVRFQNALIMLQQGFRIEDIIYENNYYDQAHLIHEFENFAYITPTDYTNYLQHKRTI
ncbi:helix-turn-helix domain-containing protein [Gracilibacillus thailandensis]|uniref:Helix-turn-helix domain-containing protein n=1 Tax=Gracilibacillus thailandensis TaxID=563735 RepID=A0A6N7QYG7_9BACI|nr:helix-turn-helix domain-containing protein [Gracilibacillus thailandensis]MRI67117.1 helix-turn-helix domain-containing protein [Gracilibacillus thailandensis]